jgi:hypothetical protein
MYCFNLTRRRPRCPAVEPSATPPKKPLASPSKTASQLCVQVHNSACTQQFRAYIHADSGLPLWSPATSSAIGCFRTNPIGSCRCWLLQELSIERWRVVVLCPSRQLHFGDPAPVAEFAEQRVRWIALLSAATNPTAPALVQALARVAGSSQAAEFDVVIAAIQVSRFNGQSIQEPCAMGGISLEDFTQSVAYREMLGRGRCKVRPEEKLREKPRSTCAS